MRGSDERERALARKKRLAALRGLARGFGLVLGPVLLAAGLPYLACRTVCVPYRTLCEEAGGEYGELADVIHQCSVPPDAPCPPGFELTSYGGCSVSSLLPATCVSPFRR